MIVLYTWDSGEMTHAYTKLVIPRELPFQHEEMFMLCVLEIMVYIEEKYHGVKLQCEWPDLGITLEMLA